MTDTRRPDTRSSRHERTTKTNSCDNSVGESQGGSVCRPRHVFSTSTGATIRVVNPCGAVSRKTPITHDQHWAAYFYYFLLLVSVFYGWFFSLGQIIFTRRHIGGRDYIANNNGNRHRNSSVIHRPFSCRIGPAADINVTVDSAAVTSGTRPPDSTRKTRGTAITGPQRRHWTGYTDGEETGKTGIAFRKIKKNACRPPP